MRNFVLFCSAIATASALGCSGSASDEGTASATDELEVVRSSPCVTATPNARYQNSAFVAQSGNVTAEWDVTPSAAGTDGAVALSARAATDWSGLAAIARFNGDTNRIDARNGAAYAASAVMPYKAGTAYHVRMIASIPTNRYSVFVKPAGLAEVQIAKDFAFRADQGTVTSLANADVNASVGGLTACNFTLKNDVQPAPVPAPAPAPAPTPTTTPAPAPAPAPGTSQSGSIAMTLRADMGAASGAVVSTGVPFAPGVLRDAKLVAVVDANGTEVPVQTSVLATWPKDGSIRSVLVAFRASLASGATAAYKLTYGAARKASTLTGLAANPDGPVSATLPAAWYTASLVSGRLIPAASDTRFVSFEKDHDSKLASMSPSYETYGVSCGTTANHRTYYDAPHALYTRFVRYGDAARYRRARIEALWYRANELRWNAGRTMAWQSCQGDAWAPTTGLDWSVLRRMLGQGMLDDYLLTGDPAARAAVVGLGESYRQNLPALVAGSRPSLEATERNMGWTILGLASYYAVDPRPEVLTALKSVVARAAAWQARGTSGAFEHDINAPDPSECERGARGASPFMTSILVDGLMDYQALTGDVAVKEIVRKAAVWYERDARSSDGLAFKYLWNCDTDAYDNSDYADLNMLIAHVFGAAYSLTGDTHWLDVGDKVADSGVSSMYVSRPKQWNQAGRGFPRYLGYRAAGRKP